MKLNLFKKMSNFVWILVMSSTQVFAIEMSDKIKIVGYHPNEVIEVIGTHFFATSIEFEKQEKIQGIYMGDQVAWTYSLSSSHPNLLWIKPTMNQSNTNMTVVTKDIIYHFHLLSDKIKEDPNLATYQLKIRLSEKRTDISKSKPKVRQLHGIQKPVYLNTHYRFTGSESIFPEQVSDDGMFTYFTFSKGKVLPAVFAIDDGKQKLINTENRSDVIIAKCIAKTFLLIRNNDRVWVENKKKL